MRSSKRQRFLGLAYVSGWDLKSTAPPAQVLFLAGLTVGNEDIAQEATSVVRSRGFRHQHWRNASQSYNQVLVLLSKGIFSNRR